MRYRVVRTVSLAAETQGNTCTHGESHATESVVWEGSDPAGYTGGIGAFDEGCYHPSRWFQAQAPDGTWADCPDPRRA